MNAKQIADAILTPDVMSHAMAYFAKQHAAGKTSLEVDISKATEKKGKYIFPNETFFKKFYPKVQREIELTALEITDGFVAFLTNKKTISRIQAIDIHGKNKAKKINVLRYELSRNIDLMNFTGILEWLARNLKWILETPKNKMRQSLLKRILANSELYGESLWNIWNRTLEKELGFSTRWPVPVTLVDMFFHRHAKELKIKSTKIPPNAKFFWDDIVRLLGVQTEGVINMDSKLTEQKGNTYPKWLPDEYKKFFDKVIKDTDKPQGKWTGKEWGKSISKLRIVLKKEGKPWKTKGKKQEWISFIANNLIED